MAATTSYIGLEGRVAVDGQHLSIRHTRLTILDRRPVQGGSDHRLLKWPPSNAPHHMSFQRENLKIYRVATINAPRQYRIKGGTTISLPSRWRYMQGYRTWRPLVWTYLSTNRQALC